MQYDRNAGLLSAGEYDALIVTAVEKDSRLGNPMIEMTLRIHGTMIEVEIKDWMVQAVPWKLRNLSNAVGHDYDSGEIVPEDLIGRHVRVRVTTEDDKTYGLRNRIADYLGAGQAVGLAPDPDVPF